MLGVKCCKLREIFKFESYCGIKHTGVLQMQMQEECLHLKWEAIST